MAQQSSSEETDSEIGGWVPWFCGVPGHEFFVEVDEEYINDNFNLYGLRNRIQYYDHALEMILMPEAPDEDDLQDADFLEVYRDAQDLYGLIHARFIVSPRGLHQMRYQFEKGVFGTCPRVLCNKQRVLPIGCSDELRVSRVKTFCPSCEQPFVTKSKYSDVDGAYFGTSFPHIFQLTFPDHESLARKPVVPFAPRIFGFKLHDSHGIVHKHLSNDHQLSLEMDAHKVRVEAEGPMVYKGRVDILKQQNENAQDVPESAAKENVPGDEMDETQHDTINTHPDTMETHAISEKDGDNVQEGSAMGSTKNHWNLQKVESADSTFCRFQ